MSGNAGSPENQTAFHTPEILNPNLHILSETMTSFTNTTTLHHPPINHHSSCKDPIPTIRASLNDLNRRKLVTVFLGSSAALALGRTVQGTPLALAENWGTRSFLRERFFEPGLSPEDATARIKQTAQGLHSIRDMLETMSWRYVLFYIRLKWAYLSQDMKSAMSMVPKNRRKDYVKTANELVDNMAEFDSYIATPKVYESYLYYEKTLKSIDELVTFLPS